MRCIQLCALTALTFSFAVRAQVDPDLLAGMKARSIGPAGMSGRVAAVCGLRSNKNVIWVGAATGGLWKSANRGLTWTPVFDDQPVASIGAVAVDQSNPDVVWVGTGEGNPRNSSSVGNGIYKTTDGGETWKHLGLSASERVHRIRLHPSDPNVAWAACLGKAWGESAERGVYKTTDGGRSWTRVLYVDERTGCCDLELDPRNPDKLIAGMWQFRRWPWFFKSGGPGSGLFVTHDGGKSWRKRTAKDGLPAGELGRIGLAIAASNPEIVYALVEAKKNVLLRSTDGGRTFKTVNKDGSVAPRPFYYCDIRVDPKDPNRIYNLHSTVTVSEDGGKSFRSLIPWSLIHPDHHAMWIHPDEPELIFEGNDGGVAVSTDRGASWRFVRNLPLAQYYHLHVDNETPYNVYGGMQDNGSWRGPSNVWENGGIRNHHWDELFFGDGFATVPDPKDSKVGYAMSQGGYLGRWNLATGERKQIRPDGPDGVKLRFNWNAGIAIDPFDPARIYYGSQFVHVSPDRGDSWKIASPDLTTDNAQWQRQAESGGLTRDVTAAENFCSILTIAPSPVKKGVLWAGTDDGRVHVSRDAGKTWKSVEQAIPGLPVNTWCPHIEACKFDAGTAFAVFDNHRRSDWTPYVYVTRDYGVTWTSLATGDLRGYVHVIEQDPVQKDLLFVGTEFGLFVSTSGGERWFQWKHGLPTVAVRALIVHPREHDLVIGTHGRAAWIVDDIRPLRTVAEDAAKPLHLFPVADAQQHRVSQTGESRFPGSSEFRGKRRPYGALLNLWVGAKPDGKARAVPVEASAGKGESPKKGKDLAIEIFDAGGQLVRELEQPAKPGLNRVVWALRSEPPQMPSSTRRRRGRGRAGPEVIPGTYRVVVKYGGHEVTGDVQVLSDPRDAIPAADRLASWKAVQDATRLMETYGRVLERIEKTRADIETIEGKLQADGDAKEKHSDLAAAAKRVQKALAKVEKTFRTPRDAKGIHSRDGIGSKVSSAFGALRSSWGKPTPTHLVFLRQARAALAKGVAEMNALFAGPVAELRAKVRAAKVELLPEVQPIEIGK